MKYKWLIMMLLTVIFLGSFSCAEEQTTDQGYHRRRHHERMERERHERERRERERDRRHDRRN